MSAPSRPIVEADLHAFVDGQMDFERRAFFVQAMAADADLRAKVEQWRRQNEAMTATFGGVLREPVPLRLMPTNFGREKPSAKDGVKARLRDPVLASPPPPQSSSMRVAAIAAAAFVAGGAMIFVAEALSFGSVLGTAPRLVEALNPTGAHALAQRAYEAHRTYATDLSHPVEVSATDEAHLLKWIQHRLAMAIRIPQLQKEGWTLLGGRILPGELGPAAFLLYANGIERLGLYVARTNARDTDTFSIFENGTGLGSVAFWVDEPIGYAITTSRDPIWLDRNGLALYRSIKTQTRDNASAE